MFSRSAVLASAAILAAATSVFGIDGVVLVNQSRALSGGVTLADTPGFPVTISASGSYRLTGNLDLSTSPSPENTTAIEITADDVTLDLNGFSILGITTCGGTPLACSPTGLGVGVRSRNHGTMVRNGRVRGMGGRGVFLACHSGVDSVHAVENGDNGIDVASSVVQHCISAANGGAGIHASDSLLFGNLVALNQAAAMRAFPGSNVIENVVVENEATGIAASSQNVIARNTATGNAGHGVACGGQCNGLSIEGNALGFNGMNGLNLTDRNLVVGNTAVQNLGIGLELAGSGFADNVVHANAVGTTRNGLAIGPNACSGSLGCP